MKQFNRHPDLSGLSLGFEYYNTKTKRRYRFTGDVTNPWQEIVDLTQEELDELKENQGGIGEVKVDGSTITKSSKGELQLGKTVGYNQEIKTEGKIIHTGDGFYSESIRDNIISSIDVNGANDISVNLGVNNYDNDSYVSGTNIIVSEERIKLSVDTHDNKLHSITISEKGIESTLTIDNNIFDGKVVTVPFLDSILSSIEIPNQELAGTVNDGTNDYSRINSSYNYYGFKCENYEGDLETLGQRVSNTEFLLPVIPLDKLKEGSPIKNTLVTSVNNVKADEFGNIDIPSPEVISDGKTITLNDKGEIQLGNLGAYNREVYLDKPIAFIKDDINTSVVITEDTIFMTKGNDGGTFKADSFSMGDGRTSLKLNKEGIITVQADRKFYTCSIPTPKKENAVLVTKVDNFEANTEGEIVTDYNNRLSILESIFNNTSPDGTKWKLGVDNNGNLITTKA